MQNSQLLKRKDLNSARVWLIRSVALAPNSDESGYTALVPLLNAIDGVRQGYRIQRGIATSPLASDQWIVNRCCTVRSCDSGSLHIYLRDLGHATDVNVHAAFDRFDIAEKT